MNAVSKRRVPRIVRLTGSPMLLWAVLAASGFGATSALATEKATARTVKVELSEWKVQLTPARVPPGPVTFEIANTGTIPHAFEIEGRSLEKSTPQIPPGATTTLELDLRAGSYEVYCPVGKGSHEMLGMKSHVTVGAAKAATAGAKAGKMEKHDDDENDSTMDSHGAMDAGGATVMKVAGGGPVIQILPGPFPFADSAQAVIRSRPADQMDDLNHKMHMGPYSNNVANISGDISLLAIDRGAAGDSVSGTAQFTSNDGSRWKLVMDRVQTKDIPFNPRFGGVIMGLYYHGASNVHTPLVPTIQSSLALWSVGHLYRNDQLVTDNAMVHIMLLSRTRRPTDWALDCWDCSNRPVEELQLQVTPPPNAPAFDSPGGFLFVNWEKSSGQRASL